jgi:predicted transcriptional regulator
MKLQDNTVGFNCDDAVKCIFNLNELDIRVYNELKKRGNMRANELAQYLHRERSTIYRSLQKLTKCGICIKKTKTLEKGGYYHSYSCSETKNIKKSANQCLERWYHLVKNTLSRLNE